jgi:hypothetical protein
MKLKEIVVRPDGKKELPSCILKHCEEDPRRYSPTIRRLAKYDNLIAMKSRSDGQWYFSNVNNYLQSPQNGLSDLEALEWLLQEDEA